MNKFNLIEELFSNKFNTKETVVANRVLKSNKEKEHMNVSINKIHPCQPVIDGSIVIKYFLSNNKMEGLEPITGVKVEDEVYLCDGHHRVAAQILSNENEIEMDIVSITKEEWQNLCNNVSLTNN